MLFGFLLINAVNYKGYNIYYNKVDNYYDFKHRLISPFRLKLLKDNDKEPAIKADSIIFRSFQL